MTKFAWRASYIIILAIVLYFSLKVPIQFILGINLIWWLYAILFIINFQFGKKYAENSLFSAIIGILILCPFWIALNVLHNRDSGTLLLLYVLTLVWVVDIAAYFIGRIWGHRQFVSKVSPNKTWLGFFAGLFFGIVYVAVIAYFMPISWKLAFIIISIITVFMAVVGDLTESVLKRQSSIKDSGAILPGHGGLLDRVDSLLAAVPIFTLGILWFGK